MKTKTSPLVILILSLVGVLLLGVSFGKAQEPQPPEVSQPMGGEAISGNVSAYIPIQGRLTDDNGNPISGNQTVTFSLYDVPTGGTAKCSNTKTVTFSSGLFSTYILNCTSETINGQMLYLGIKVASDAEMTPRSPIYPVPYAWSLKPGAVIQNASTLQHALEVSSDQGGGSSGTTLWVRNTSSINGIALWARADGTDATVISSNNGSGPLFKGFGADGGEHEYIVYNDGTIWTEGDVNQARTADGLVKAAFFGSCGSSGSLVDRSFNNVGGTVSVSDGASAGTCIIDFGFDISDRYFAATAYSSGARGVSCYTVGGEATKLRCYRWNDSGSGENGVVVVMIY